jgi:hypothetical protein
MSGNPIRRARRGVIRLADSTVIAFPKLTHPRAGLSHAHWRALSPVEKIERQLGLSLDQMAEIMSRPWEECDAAWIAIKTRVLCVFLAIGAKMIRALPDGTLDYAAACGRAGGVTSATAPGRSADAPACTGKPGRRRGMASKNWRALANRGRFFRCSAPAMRMRLRARDHLQPRMTQSRRRTNPLAREGSACRSSCVIDGVMCGSA